MCFTTDNPNSQTSLLIPKISYSLHEPKILIIGAGAAGIACATKLLNMGFKDVIIYEAKDRIGGRIFTIPFADNVVDMGAQWCHGENGNVIYEMVNEFGYLDNTEDYYTESKYIRSDGLTLDDETVLRLKEIMERVLWDRQTYMKDYTGSYGAYLSEKFFLIFNESEYDDLDERVAHEFLTNFLKIEGAETAANVLDVSAAGLLTYWECDGNYMINWKTEGYHKLLQYMLEAESSDLSDLGILNEVVRYNKCVDKIYWNRDDEFIEVRCGEYDSILVDHVVVTVSLGVLKAQHKELFEPNLPAYKQDVIDAIGFGTILKIYLEFPNTFWPDDWHGFNALWTVFDIEDLKETPKNWLCDILGFYRVKFQPRVLLGWLGGQYVPMVEQMDTVEVLKNVMFMLRKFLPQFEIPEPINIAVSNWTTDSNILGTYSYPSMKTKIPNQNNICLAQPLTMLTNVPSTHNMEDNSDDDEFPESQLKIKPAIQFAGEATHSHFYSTVHGAVESGWREARRLSGYYETEL